jgi:hypothetical protein
MSLQIRDLLALLPDPHHVGLHRLFKLSSACRSPPHFQNTNTGGSGTIHYKILTPPRSATLVGVYATEMVAMEPLSRISLAGDTRAWHRRSIMVFLSLRQGATLRGFWAALVSLACSHCSWIRDGYCNVNWRIRVILSTVAVADYLSGFYGHNGYPIWPRRKRKSSIMVKIVHKRRVHTCLVLL